MKKRYPEICNGLPDYILEKLLRYTENPKDPIEKCYVEIYDRDYNLLSPEDKLVINLRGITIKKKRKVFGMIETYTAKGFQR